MTLSDAPNPMSGEDEEEEETFETAWQAGWEGGWDVGFEDGCDAAADYLVEAAIEAGFRAGLEATAEFRSTLAAASRGDQIRIVRTVLVEVQEQFEVERQQRAISEARESFEGSPDSGWIGSDPPRAF